MSINAEGRLFDVDSLIELRDLALVNSRFFDITAAVGSVTFGPAVAEWDAEDHSTARLIQTGPDYKRRAMFGRYTTRLMLETVYDGLSDNEGMQLEKTAHRQTFMMSLNAKPKIRVFNNLIPAGVKYGLEMPKRDIRKEKHHGLLIPNDDDIEMLIQEMKRGASGAYAKVND